jgi:hypothetical protein
MPLILRAARTDEHVVRPLQRDRLAGQLRRDGTIAAPATSGIQPRSGTATAPTRSSTETASAVPGGAVHT